MTVERLGELLNEAAKHANACSSIAASDPWYITAACWLLPQLEEEFKHETR